MGGARVDELKILSYRILHINLLIIQSRHSNLAETLHTLAAMWASVPRRLCCSCNRGLWIFLTMLSVKFSFSYIYFLIISQFVVFEEGRFRFSLGWYVRHWDGVCGSSWCLRRCLNFWGDFDAAKKVSVTKQQTLPTQKLTVCNRADGVIIIIVTYCVTMKWGGHPSASINILYI